MFEKLEQESLLENKAKPHPNISFVYVLGKQYFCLQHTECTPMNRGAMKQHIRGKQHKLDFKTGERIDEKEFYHSDMSKNMKKDFNQKFMSVNSERGKFFELEEKLDVFDFPKYVKNVLLAEHGLDDKLKDNVLFCLHYLEVIKKIEETQSNTA